MAIIITHLLLLQCALADTLLTFPLSYSSLEVLAIPLLFVNPSLALSIHQVVLVYILLTYFHFSLLPAFLHFLSDSRLKVSRETTKPTHKPSNISSYCNIKNLSFFVTHLIYCVWVDYMKYVHVEWLCCWLLNSMFMVINIV